MTREEWLNAALTLIREKLAAVDCLVPTDARVSVGFPGGGSARKRVGECWSRAGSSLGINEIFISPIVASPFDALGILVHEAIHAADNCASGHKGAFKRAALAVGLEGKMTSTVPGAALSAWLHDIIATKLPTLEHGSLSLGGRKKQSTRMLKFKCSDCDCTVRASEKWADTIRATQCACGGSFHG